MRLQRNRFRPQIDVLSSRIAPSADLAGDAVMPVDESAYVESGTSGQGYPADESAVDSALNEVSSNSEGTEIDPMEPRIPGEDEYHEASPMPPGDWLCL